MTSVTGQELSAGDAVWIATALLHREHPERTGFSVKEIAERVAREHLTSRQSMTIYQHANQHCVANRPPNAAKLRMIVETPDGLRRLYRDGDPTDPRRKDSRCMPEHLPEPYSDLATWYARWSQENRNAPGQEDDLLAALAGSWIYGDSDAYVNHLRDGWE